MFNRTLYDAINDLQHLRQELYDWDYVPRFIISDRLRFIVEKLKSIENICFQENNTKNEEQRL